MVDTSKKKNLLTPALDRTAGADPQTLNESEREAQREQREFLSENNTGSTDRSSRFSVDELDAVCDDVLAGVDLPADGAAASSPGAAIAETPVIELPVLEREHIEAGLVFVHDNLLAPKYGEHWKLTDLNKKALVPALDKWLLQTQGKVENLLGTWLTRWAGEHRETAALVLVMVAVYLPKVRETLKQSAEETAGAETATSTTE